MEQGEISTSVLPETQESRGNSFNSKECRGTQIGNQVLYPGLTPPGELLRKGKTMAYFMVPNIKDEKVVCQKPCIHTDCKLNREEWANARCDDCRKSLTAGMVYFYKQTTPIVLHRCLDCAFT